MPPKDQKFFHSYEFPVPIAGAQRPQKSHVFTTGPILRNPNTEIVVVTLLNEDFYESKTVTVSVLDWQNTWDPTEFAKVGFLAGQAINPSLSTQGVQPQQTNIVPPNNVQSIFTPLIGTIPPRGLFTIHASPPQPVHLPSPCYEVIVTFSSNFTHPPTPIRRVIVNTFGINAEGVPQEGNTVLHNQLIPRPITSPVPFSPIAPITPPLTL
ncbi:hypothetical protein BACCIP111899_01875 [Bacillus rhizoplanae]|uniref:Uncharacterized protein n=1 Tax=Bacillus rhizoplanae TaxID=2880966 RepID=A0ABM8YAF0_9BACI|nr:hypothetical protein [Bacillus rhizoplanae]CAG9612698.1 hypothetical protein BACCIP111899_01875 [Bacillus rhizoplanae]